MTFLKYFSMTYDVIIFWRHLMTPDVICRHYGVKMAFETNDRSIKAKMSLLKKLQLLTKKENVKDKTLQLN